MSITTKELSAIEDQLGMEQVIVKKYQLYASQTNDPQLKVRCEQIAAKHQEHFNTLFAHLN